jgi:O-antigen ligase
VALVYAILAESVLDGLYRLIAASLLGAVVLTVARSGGSGEAARASGTMGDANEWATIVLLLGSFSLGGLASDPTALGRVLRLGVLIGLPVAIVRSESRSALLAAALVIPALVWLLRGRRGELGLAGLALGLVAPVVLVSDRAWERFGRLLDRFRGGGGAEDASLDERAELFRQGVSLFEDHWFLGVGAGNFANATGFVSRAGRLRPAHNTYLEVAGEQGVVGLSALAAFGVTVAWTLRHALRNARTERDRQRLGGAAIGLAAVAIMAATLGLLTFAMAWLVLGIALALAHQARRG